MMDARMTNTQERLMLAVAGAAQGVAIWLLIETWSEEHAARVVVVAGMSFVSVLSLVLHFAWTGSDTRRVLMVSASTGLVYAAVAGWVGWSMPAAEGLYPGTSEWGFVWFLTSSVTLYALGPFLQVFQRIGRPRFEYAALFEHSWNNFFVALVGVVFVVALWAVLLMWGELFELIGIDFFSGFFSEKAFAWPVSGAAVGFGIALGRESERVVSTLRGIALAVFRGLLPLVCAVAIVFVASLPFTGLETLWETNHASQLLLTWVGLTVLFLNAVYQDGQAASPVPGWVRRIVEVGLLVMSGFVGISAYGLHLRIDQYGLTPSRMWGVLFTIVLGAYAIGYGAAVLRRNGPWLASIRGVNLATALLIVAIGLLAHTPILDPIGWSAESQVARLVERRSTAAEFDYGYLRFQLGSAGRAALDALDDLDSHPEIAIIREQLVRIRGVEHYWEWKSRGGPILSRAHFVAFPPDAEIPDGVIKAARGSQIWNGQSCEETLFCGAFSVELDGPEPEEWVLIAAHEGWSQISLFAIDTDAGEAAYAYVGPLHHVRDQPESEALRKMLEAGRFGSIEPVHQDLTIGENHFRVVPH